jgi:hypothetical protein
VTVVGRRACAALAACSAVLHGFSLGHTTSAWAITLILSMLTACLFCARELWIRDTLRAWVVVALMNLAMIAIHAPAAAAHHHGGAGSHVEVHHSTVMTLATVLAMVEVVAAAAVLYHRARGSRDLSYPPVMMWLCP